MAKKKEEQAGAQKKSKGKDKAPKPMVEKREPRLLRHYRDHVRSALQEKFGYANIHQIPKIEKVPIGRFQWLRREVSCGVGGGAGVVTKMPSGTSKGKASEGFAAAQGREPSW